jgi:hypothetical protein
LIDIKVVKKSIKTNLKRIKTNLKNKRLNSEIEKIFMDCRSELGKSIVEVHGLVSCWAFGVVTRLACVGIYVRGEKLDHISQIKAYEQGGNPEPKHGDSHGKVCDDWWGFVSQVEVFFVVDVITSHFPNQGVKGTFSSQSVVSFRLVLSEVLRSVSV